MACYSPVQGWRSGGGAVVFNKRHGFVDLPVKVSCGRCIGCKLERSRQWAIRCVCEAQMHPYNSFLTLTYDDANLPADKSVDVKTWQLFAKKLRKRCGPFRFYHCGEYGSQTNRPHYHSIVFGLDFHSDRKELKPSKFGDTLYTSELLDEIWGLGNCYIGSVTAASAGYVARYVMKRHDGVLSEYTYGERVCQDTGLIDYYRSPPYSTMSRRPGIGHSWIHTFHTDVYPRDEMIHDGYATHPPKFFDTQLEKADPSAHKKLLRDRQRKASKHEANRTPDRLHAREQVTEAKLKQLKRETN